MNIDILYDLIIDDQTLQTIARKFDPRWMFYTSGRKDRRFCFFVLCISTLISKPYS